MTNQISLSGASFSLSGASDVRPKLSALIKDMCPNGVEYKKLGEVCEVYTGGEPPVDSTKSKVPEGDYIYPIYSNGIGENAIYGYAKTYTIEERGVTFSSIGTIGHPTLREGKFTPIIRLKVIIPKDESVLNISFVKYALDVAKFSNNKSSLPNINAQMLKQIEIPIPPPEIQKKIVECLDKFSALAAELQAELQMRRKQYEYYRTHLLTPHSESNSADNTDDAQWEWTTLGEIGKVCMCKRILKNETNSQRGIPFYKIGTFGGVANAYISEQLYEEYKQRYSYPKKGDVLISAAGTIGKSVIFDGEPSYFQDSNIVWIANNEKKVLNKYLYYYYQIVDWKVDDGGVIKRLYNDNLRATPIAYPSLEEQARIVSILDKFEALTTSLSDGIPAEQAAQQKRYEYYRDLLLTFDRKAE